MFTSLRFRTIAATLFAMLAVSGAYAQGGGGARPPRVIDRANLDTTCAPCTNFYQFANGGWLAKTSIPADKASLGSFGMLGDKNQAVVRGIVDDDAKLVRGGETKPGTNEWKVGTFFMACMDTAAIERAGLSPIRPVLNEIAAIKTTDDVVKVFGERRAGGGGGGRGGGGGLAPFGINPGSDPKRATDIILNANQGGLSLPDRDDYLKDDARSVKLREDYLGHLSRTFRLLGDQPADADAHARAVLELETKLARVTVSRVALRDPNATYHKMSLAEFQKMTPNIDWTRYLKQQGAKGVAPVNVRTPSYFASLDSLLPAVPVADWKAYLRWHMANGSAASLTRAFRDEAFRWTSITTGVQEQQPRVKQCSQGTSAALGDAVGQEYVKRTFTPEAKARAVKMVDNLVNALRQRITHLDWMSQATKDQAVQKLDAFLRKVAYPDKWRDYATLDIKTGGYAANLSAVAEWNSARSWARLGKPLDKTEWSMTPPTVNASYSPSLNQIQFPTGILAPPFFDPNADDAVNYGAIGAVIGHEMTHGFDDQGRQFDAAGNLRDWWTPEDAAKYKVAAQRVVDQFNGYTVVDDKTFVNGQLTQGENIADFGGLTVAYSAMETALGNKPRTKIDGFTPEQRFFLAWAQIWRTVQRDQAAINQVKTDPHSPGKWRVNGPLSNMPEFKAAWGCKDGDSMVRADSIRARIW